MSRMAAKVFLVSNEVWSGIVPDNALARRFRDIAGTLNQRIAGVTTQVDLVVVGFSVRTKGCRPQGTEQLRVSFGCLSVVRS